MTQVSTTQGRGAVVGRAFGWGGVCGAVAGAVAGSVAIPVLGTAFGGAVGALVGAAFGIVNGMVLSALGPGATHGSARAVAALISAGCGVAAFAVVPPRNGQGRLLLDVGFVAVCAVLGALVGPAARFGLERKASHGRPRRSVADAVGRGLVFGAAGGGLVGVTAGLLIGLVTYVPTAFFALFEGGIFGGVVGAVLGLAVAAGFVIATSRIR